MWGTDRHWTDFTKHQWTQCHRTNRRYSVMYCQTVDRLCNPPVNGQMVPGEVVTDCIRTIQNTSGLSYKEPTDGTVWGTDRLYKTPVDTVTKNQQTVHYKVLTDIGQTLQDTTGNNDTKSTICTVWGTDRQWADCTRHQWTQWHRTNRLYNMRYWQTVDRLYKTSVGAVSDPTGGTIWNTDRQWTVYTRHPWTQWHRTNKW